MKRLTVTLSFFFVLSTQAQITDTGNNVGIGFNNPGQKLDVKGAIRSFNSNPGVNATWDNVTIWSDGYNGYLHSNGDEGGFFIKSNSGNLIHLESPVASLTSQGQISITNGTANWDNISLWSDGTKGYIQTNGDEDGLFIKSNDGDRIILESKVGIGEQNPSSLLHISSSNSNQLIIQEEIAGGAATLRLDVAGGAPLNTTIRRFGSGHVLSGKLGFSLDGGINQHFLIDQNGNIGIGLNSPCSNCKLDVDGKIRSEEIIVEVVNGPDYVFEDDYDLRTLKETKEYISKNNHLPEIPSAKEMEANGVGLADMNMRLLKKIEELTLYQIELLEKLEQQNKQLQEQHKRIENLENK